MPGCEGHRWHCIWKGFRPRIKTPVPGIRIRIGGRSQYNIGLHFVLFVVGLPQFREGGQSFSFGGHCPPPFAGYGPACSCVSLWMLRPNRSSSLSLPASLCFSACSSAYFSGWSSRSFSISMRMLRRTSIPLMPA